MSGRFWNPKGTKGPARFTRLGLLISLLFGGHAVAQEQGSLISLGDKGGSKWKMRQAVPLGAAIPLRATRDSSRLLGGRNLRVEGRFIFETPSLGQTVGVDHIYYEVRDDDVGGHSVLYSGYTDAEGYFDTGVVDVSDDDNEPDVYMYFETTSPDVTVETAGLGNNYSWDTYDNELLDDFTGDYYNFGTLFPGNTGVGSNIPALNAFQLITRAHRMVQIATTLDIPHVDVVWPTGDDFEFNYNGAMWLGEFIYLDRQVLHLYAHHLERSVGMQVGATNGCGGDCQFCSLPSNNCQSLPDCPWCPMAANTARSEAFASWFPTSANREFQKIYTDEEGEPYRVAGITPFEDFPPEIIPDDPFDDVTDLSEARELCGADVVDHANLVIEAIASFFEDLADAEMDDHAGDELNECAAFGDWWVLRAYLLDKPANVLDMIDQLIDNHPNDSPELYSTALNISHVYAERFSPDTEPPGIVLIVDSPTHPDPLGSPLPCITTEWSSPLDDVTGACGYSYTWWNEPDGLPADNIEDFSGTCVSRTDGPFTIGEQYLTIRAVDCEGNWATQDRTFGPFEVTDCNNNELVDVCDISCVHPGYEGCEISPAFCSVIGCGLSSDCNANLAPDECDIAEGKSEDCNNNGIPDECENMSHWGTVSGSWHDGSYWEEGTVPGENYHVCVRDREGDIGVVYAEGTHEVASVSCDESLTLQSRNYPAAGAYLTVHEGGFVHRNLRLQPVWNAVRLTIEDDLQVNGELQFAGGELNGPGTVNVFGSMVVEKGSKAYAGGIELYGPTTSFDRLLVSNGIAIHNNNGQTWEHRVSGDVFSQTSGVFINDGVFRKTTDPGDARIGCRIENGGEVRVEAGKLIWWSGSETSGDVLALPGTVFELNCGGHDFLSSSSITAETMHFAGSNCGQIFIRGTYNVSGTTTKSSGSNITFTEAANIIDYAPIFSMTGLVNFNAPYGGTIHFESFACGAARFNTSDPLEFVNLTLNGNGCVTNNAPITVTGHLDWWGGASFAGSGEVNVNGTTQVRAASQAHTISNRTFNNQGYATVQGSMSLTGNTVLKNMPTGTIDIQVDAGGSVIGGTKIENYGMFLKSAGAGTSRIGLQMTNYGTVEVRTGTLEFYTYYGYFYIQEAGQTILNGGNINIFGPASFVINGGLLTGNGTVTGTSRINGGGIAPGLSVGELILAGTYHQAAGATYFVGLAGRGVGEFDRVTVSGAANLAGALEVSEVSGFTPLIGDSFEILTASSIAGEFDTLVANYDYAIEYADDAVILHFPSRVDLDGDYDGDLADWGTFQKCFNPGGGARPADCPLNANADFDGDGDVDFDDAAAFANGQLHGPHYAYCEL